MGWWMQVLKTAAGRLAPTLAAALVLFGTAAFAAGADQPVQSSQPAQAAQPGQMTQPPTLGGDLGGLRTGLAAAGVQFGITYVGEAFGNLSGGNRRGAVYDGMLSAMIDADLEKIAGWKGAKVHLQGFDVHGEGPSREFLDSRSVMMFSSIEARPSLRLFMLWFDQSLFDDRLSIRFGELAADSEFIISDTATKLISATFGWPAIASSDMIEGGPTYPMSSPGVRLQLKPTSDITVLAGAFAAKAGGEGCTVDPEICNPYGVRFPLAGGTLMMGELQYALSGKNSPTGLPGTYKIGGWHETGGFTDQFTGLRAKSGDQGIYAVADQTVWRREKKPKEEGQEQSLSLFLRVGAAPPDRNLVSLYVDGGVGWNAPVPGRPDDVLTLGASYSGISADAAAAARLLVPPAPPRRYETVVELDYQAQIRPGWTLQPDLQYLIHPGGGVSNPVGRGAIPNTLVLGLRTTLAF
jgi:porin